MLHAITQSNRDSYQTQLEQSYRIRHKVFVDGLGWDELRRDDQREIDQFDTDETIHLLFLSDDQKTVLGGSRLLPTTRPHLLSEIFPHLATNQDIPRGSDIYEWTRFYINPATRDHTGSCGASQQIMCGIQEYCLDAGITQLSAVAEPYWLPRLARFGWRPQPLGLPQEHDADTDVIGLKMEVSQAALERTRKGHPFPNRIVFR